MYASFANQLKHMLHYGFAFTLLFLLWPRVLFPKEDTDRLQQVIGSYIQMVLLVIVLGYVLVVTKLYEVLSVIAVLLVLSLRKYVTKGTALRRVMRQTELATLFYDYLDQKFTLRQLWQRWASDKSSAERNRFRDYLSSPARFGRPLLFITIFAIAAGMRFTDAIRHAAPGLSDGYVTLVWLKYMDARLLFHDGIYPQGFHIVLSLLHKFSGIDALYILKYTGPLNTMLLILGFYFVVSRWTRSDYSGLIAAAAYGLLSALFTGGSYDRQASTNSQEFAMIFVLPTLHFFYMFLKTRKREHFWVAAAGTAATGLIHSLPFALLGMGLTAELAIALLLFASECWKEALYTVSAGVGAVVLSVLPYPLGMLLGAKVHASSEEYLTSTSSSIAPPVLHAMDWAALACGVVALTYGLLPKRDRWDRLPPLFTALFTAGIFAVYYWGGTLTHSVLLASRSGDLWGVCIPLAIGMAWFALMQAFVRLRSRVWLELVLSTAVIAGSLILVPPKPIIPYKLERDSFAEQYLAISEQFRPKTWMIISLRNEVYDYVYGTGFHMYAAPDPAVRQLNLLESYDPTKMPLTKYGEQKYDRNIPNDIFIYMQNSIYRVAENNSIYPLMKPKYELWQRQIAELQAWIDKYKETHRNGEGQSITVFYQDDNLTIYHLHRDQTREEEQKLIWG